MANPFDDDDDDMKDEILKGLGGEADDFAANQLDSAGKAAGVTIEITVKPKGEAPAEEEGKEGEEGQDGGEGAPDGEHDPIAHVLGLCKGGCGY